MMERDFNKLPPEIQKSVRIAQSYANNFVDENEDLPIKNTFDFEDSGGKHKAVFRLVEKDGRKFYEFNYVLLNI
jgi:hypothetical protein